MKGKVEKGNISNIEQRLLTESWSSIRKNNWIKCREICRFFMDMYIYDNFINYLHNQGFIKFKQEIHISCFQLK